MFVPFPCLYSPAPDESTHAVMNCVAGGLPCNGAQTRSAVMHLGQCESVTWPCRVVRTVVPCCGHAVRCRYTTARGKDACWLRTLRARSGDATLICTYVAAFKHWTSVKVSTGAVVSDKDTCMRARQYGYSMHNLLQVNVHHRTRLLLL